MTPPAYRPRAAGPGWKPEEFEAVYLAQADGDPRLALKIACIVLSRELCGGRLRPPPADGAAVVNVDSVEPLDLHDGES
jgi:hypothetical protein